LVQGPLSAVKKLSSEKDKLNVLPFFVSLASHYFFYSSEWEEEPSNQTVNIRKYSIDFFLYQAQQAVQKN
jgi:hypothetical protein